MLRYYKANLTCYASERAAIDDGPVICYTADAGVVGQIIGYSFHAILVGLAVL